MVVVIVHVATEGRVKVNVAVLRRGIQGLSDAGVFNPLLQARRPHRVINDALRRNKSESLLDLLFSQESNIARNAVLSKTYHPVIGIMVFVIRSP